MIPYGSIVRVVEGVGLPSPELVGGIGPVIGSMKETPIVVVKKNPSRKGACWAIPENCLKIIGTEEVQK